jgi:hypothetical protein
MLSGDRPRTQRWEICGLMLRATSSGIGSRIIWGISGRDACAEPNGEPSPEPGSGLLNYLPFPLHVSL